MTFATSFLVLVFVGILFPTHSEGAKISASRVYSSADCTDAGEKKIGEYSVNDCAKKCVQKLPNTKFISYGKGSRSRECYCEYTSSCSKRGSHGSFDVYKLNFSVDCVLGPWKAKGSCSKKCGTGKRTFERSITKNPSGGGKACTATTQSRNCNTQKCPIQNIYNDGSDFKQGGQNSGFDLKSMSGCSKEIKDKAICGYDNVKREVQIWINNLKDAWKCATSVDCCHWDKHCGICIPYCTKWTCQRNETTQVAKKCKVTNSACKSAMNKLGSQAKNAIMGKIPKQLVKVMNQLGGSVNKMMKKVWEYLKGFYNKVKNDQRVKAIVQAIKDLKSMYKQCIVDQGVNIDNFIKIIKNAVKDKKEKITEINMGNIFTCIAIKARDRQAFWITEYTTGFAERRRLNNGGVKSWTSEKGSSILISFGGGVGYVANVAFSFDFYIRIKDLISPNFSDLDFGFYTSKTACIGLGGIGYGIGLTIQYFHGVTDIPGHSVDFAFGGGADIEFTAHLTWALPTLDLIGFGGDIGVSGDFKTEEEEKEERRRLGASISLLYCYCLNDLQKGMLAAGLPNNIGYEGCFQDDKNDRDLKDAYWKNDKMTAGKCITHCSDKKFRYAGVQNGKECRCGKDYRTKAKHKKLNIITGCNTNCGGNFWFKCGGPLANDIYQTDPNGDVPIVKDYQEHKNRFSVVEDEDEEEEEISSNYSKIVGFSFAGVTGTLLVIFIAKFRNRNKLQSYELIADV